MRQNYNPLNVKVYADITGYLKKKENKTVERRNLQQSKCQTLTGSGGSLASLMRDISGSSSYP